MNRRLGAAGIGLLMAGCLVRAVAATPVASIYLESLNALQRQMFQSAEVFEAPELGAVPMLISMGLPGASQLDPSAPLGLHIYDIGNGRAGYLMEVTPAAGQVERLLQAVAGSRGQALPPPVDGLYVFEGGAARMAGGQLLLARSVEDLDACMGGTFARPALPAVNGVFRITVRPTAMRPLVNVCKAAADDMRRTQKDEAWAAVQAMTRLYDRALAQLAAVEMGMAVEPEGLFLRSRVTPEPGTAAVALIRSLKPVGAAPLALLDPGSLFSMATGAYTLPVNVERQLLDFYRRLLDTLPAFSAVDPDEIMTMVKFSLSMLGAPTAMSGRLDPEVQALRLQGLIGVADAADGLARMLAMVQSHSYRTMLAQVGMTVAGPVQRMHGDTAVHTLQFHAEPDLDALRVAIRAQRPSAAAQEAGIKAVQKMVPFFGHGAEYAATTHGMVFGLGAPAMIEQALARTRLAAPSAEAARITARVSPVTAPVAVCRFALLEALGMGWQARQASPAVKTALAMLKGGEGVVGAAWVEGDQLVRAVLVPAADIKVLGGAIRSMQGF